MIELGDQHWGATTEDDASALRDPARLRVLYATGLLDTPPEESFDWATRTAVKALRAPVSLLVLVDERRQYFTSQYGLTESWTTCPKVPLLTVLCQPVVSGRPFAIDDARAKPALGQNPGGAEPGFVAYAGVPLVTSDGARLGSLCVLDRRTRTWTDDDLATLRDLAMGVMIEIERRLQAQQTERQRRELEDDLVKSDARLNDLLDHTSDLVQSVDAQGRITSVNRAWREVLGYGIKEIDHLSLPVVVAPESRKRFDAAFVRAAAGEPFVTVEAVLTAKHGRQVAVEGHLWGQRTGDTGAVRCIFRDVSERKDLEAKLVRLASYDALTGLSNRTLFAERLRQVLSRGQRHRATSALFYLDVDDFREVNDQLGHEAGDRVLAEAAQRIVSCVRQEDTVARLGGDEFTVLIEHVGGDIGAASLAKRLIATMQQPFMLGVEVQLSASVGVAFGRPGAVAPDDLIRAADEAMVRAKRMGPGRYALSTTCTFSGVNSPS